MCHGLKYIFTLLILLHMQWTPSLYQLAEVLPCVCPGLLVPGIEGVVVLLLGCITAALWQIKDCFIGHS